MVLTIYRKHKICSRILRLAPRIIDRSPFLYQSREARSLQALLKTMNFCLKCETTLELQSKKIDMFCGYLPYKSMFLNRDAQPVMAYKRGTSYKKEKKVYFTIKKFVQIKVKTLFSLERSRYHLNGFNFIINVNTVTSNST